VPNEAIGRVEGSRTRAGLGNVATDAVGVPRNVSMLINQSAQDDSVGFQADGGDSRVHVTVSLEEEDSLAHEAGSEQEPEGCTESERIDERRK
jgi:hypothetical protein